MTSSKIYIVLYDDSTMAFSYGVDPDFEGALLYASPSEPVAGFYTRAEASKAIKISQKFAELDKLRGKPYCEEFINGNRKHIKIRMVRMVEPEKAKE